ncbi:relaxase/mobilization nuclease domain-containing protein [Larkinella sp. C7]|uniref:relaxase/mobilization nuclease domain-containing protein n=1 Tax=Larkinella sp. C7 TaxID=2576607 RepID=UPI00148632DF|nr:relaxase/mobilization nuclease domain-containing protein [Larkinella sp. C7]
MALRNYVGILIDPDLMQKQQVAYMLEQQAALNPRISKPTFHVSLSLAPGEKPDAMELLAIADRYMDGMGYGGQPYAVYQHFDTDHTHVHVVSIRVNEKGDKVPDKFERERSNKLRQQIEKEFNLVEAEKVALKKSLPHLKPVHYGQGDLKQAITNVVLTVLNDFRFSSFAQYNQLLNLYNVQAVEVPLEGKKPGMVYTVAKEQEREGIAFKSSSLRQQPTRETVERRIKAGKKAKQDAAPRMRRLIEERLTDGGSWVEFQQKLHRMNILILPHQGKDGNLFGISFIDAKQKMIYSGSELSKDLSAGSLKNRFSDRFVVLPKEDIKPKAERVIQPKIEHKTPAEEPVPDSDTSLIRRLLYAAVYMDDQQESEQELKKMTRKLKPRL